MNTIREYVESMFISVPKTKETKQLKTDILANMEDKYQELRDGGASENEAIGSVITEFGNIDEVLEEMGIQKEATLDELDDVMIVEEEDAFEYIEAKRRGGTGIGLGVLSILVGLGGFLMIMGLGGSTNTAIGLGLIFFLICTALGVGLFILHGMRLSEYCEFSESFYVLIPEVRQKIEEMQKDYKRSHALSLVLGVVICVLSCLPIFISLFLGSNEFFLIIAAGMTLVFVGIGVFFFIFTGNVWGAYENLLTHGQTFADIQEAREEARRKTKVLHFMESIYWPVILILFLGWSFLFESWAYSWLIWIVAGVVYSGVLMFFDIDE